MRQILVVEDNKDINEMITNALKTQGYNVHQTYNAVDALRVFREVSLDCIITDLMLPIVSGEELIEEVRKTSKVHIIVISAKTRTMDKLEGLRLGADDYLYKPFISEEIIYKLTNLFAKEKPSNVLSFNNGELIFEHGINQLIVHKHEVELTSVEYRMMTHFIENLNKVISRDQFLNVLYEYGEEDVYDRVVDVHIKNIRQKIKRLTDTTYIKTVYGLGYSFVGDLDE